MGGRVGGDRDGSRQKSMHPGGMRSGDYAALERERLRRRERWRGGWSAAWMLVVVSVASLLVVVAALVGYRILLSYTTPQIQDRRTVPIWEFPTRDELADIRYLLEGTTYFISAWNEQNEERSILENRKRNAEMLMEISVMYPQPTLVFDAVTDDQSFNQAFLEGFVLYFSHPTAEMERSVSILARVFGQVSLLKWWPHVWGVDADSHVTLMQSSVPVASAVRPVMADAMAREVDLEDGEEHDSWLQQHRQAELFDGAPWHQKSESRSTQL